jgi:cardiolipin synthase
MLVTAQFEMPALSSILYALIELAAIVSALHAIWYVRSTQAAIAWMVGLIAMPILTLPIYWVFGRYRFQGYRESIRDVGTHHKRSVAAIEQALHTSPNARTTPLQTPLDLVADVLDTPICDHNACTLLIDGEAFFDELDKQIDAAQRYVYVEFYIVRNDDIGKRLANKLIDAAKRGVVVRMLYDEIGSVWLPKRYVRRLSEAGVDVRAFNTRRGPTNPFQLNFRNHRKIVVVDGHTAIVGGLNIGNEYVGKATWTDHWRDTAVLLQGPITNKVQAVFAGDYYWAAREDLPEADWHVPATKSGATRAAVCVTGPADELPKATMMFLSLAHSAERRLWIATPYLVPDDACLIGLKMARARGVDVRVLLPAVPDAWSVFLAGYYYEQELLEAGIAVYRYQPGQMHQKCLLVDDDVALIGSTNLDNRSLHLNFELLVALADDDLIREVHEMLDRDFARSSETQLTDPPEYKWRYRFGRIIARLFSPIL